MEDWLERYARELDVLPLDDDERTALLRLARDVAHGTERRFAPLSTFLAGVAVGRRGGDRADTLAAALAAARRLLPEVPDADDGPGDGPGT